MILTLPYPPSVNTYWRSVRGRLLISRGGRLFREHVRRIVLSQANRSERFVGRLRVTVDLFPPDRRRRDIDNAMKATLDALGHAGVYDDDSQIDELTIRRQACLPGGQATVTIEEM